jgi:hypothetical protein
MTTGAWKRHIGSMPARPVAAAVVLVLPAVAFHGPWRWMFEQGWLRIVLLVLAGVLGGALLPARAGSPLLRVLVGVQASTAAVLLGTPVDTATSYPFSLDWSEGDRMWASSLLFGSSRYHGLTPELHPDYASPAFFLFQGLAFLFPGLTILQLRAWTAFLLVCPSLVLAGSVFLGGSRWPVGALRWSLVLWAFLFVMQGPAYAPLVVGAVAVVLAFRSRRPGWVVPAALLAGFFVGISRWTWMLAPAIWSSTWALLDPAIEETARWRRAIAYAAAGVVGAALSLGWTVWIEHRPLFLYITSVRHVILKYRILPNQTSSLGIGPWIALVSAPAVILILWRWRRSGLWKRWTVPLMVGAGALLLFAIGLVASLKIGAGDNLHHFDMFLINLVIILGATIARGDEGVILRQDSGRPTLLAAIVLVAPVISAMSLSPTPLPPSEEVAGTSLERVQEAVAEAAGRGPVLFIDQRQLLTFGLVPEAELVWDYDLLDLMDQAMANAEDYLHRFQADLAAQRFGLIVTDPLPVIWRDRADSFGEESDAWVRHIAVPVLEHYRPIAELDEVGVWLLEPVP